MPESLTIRKGKLGDEKECGRIMCNAFTELASRYYCRSDVPTVEMGVEFAKAFIEDKKISFFVAEFDGKIVGSNTLHMHNEVAGIGPITVDPPYQGRGIGRALMNASISEAKEAGFERIRLCADAFNRISVPLYSSLGFRPDEVLAFVIGKPKAVSMIKIELKEASDVDIDTIDKISKDILGFSRKSEVRQIMSSGGKVLLGIRDGRAIGYMTELGLFGHGMAYNEEELKAMIIKAADKLDEISFLLPARRIDFFKWALSSGLRVEKFMILMCIGSYNEPKGAYFPSVIY